MKKIILFIGILYIGILALMGATKIGNYNIYDELIRQNSAIVEQGIKVQYTQNKIDSQKLLTSLNLIDKAELYGDNFIYTDDNKEYFFEIRGIDSFIEIEFIFYNNEIKIEDVEKIVKNKFKDKKDLSIFTYVKGKISDNHSFDEKKYIENKFIKNISCIEINNGKTGMIELKNQEVFNYSQISYGKDNSYIIVGSPVIFISY
ncbi:MAG: hypothetical protein ACRC57_12700 [Sarcina sp.]